MASQQAEALADWAIAEDLCGWRKRGMLLRAERSEKGGSGIVAVSAGGELV